MKLNWGHYIFISFTIFVMLIVYMVYRSYQFDNHLVAEDYYAQELDYQNVIEKRDRAGKLENDLTWASVSDGISINYPSELQGIKGSIYLFRPSDEDLDLRLDIAVDSLSTQLIQHSDLQSGKYIVQIDWTYNEIDYFTEGVVFINK